ncbi:DUF2207 domain-containing protein [Bacillus songklensis]|uniref:DUF2207 domain-containing protein n=1 Tax=Bacillus songklensis TaxID=1069116 RepID=A0ABV8B1G2_9BACI
MADKRIKGITIEIGGETTGLDKALKNVNKQSVSLQQELKQVERLLKFNPGNTEAIAQKQKLLSDQIAVTSEKLNQLKAAQAQVDAQFAAGKISEETYRAFRREIEFTQGSLDGLRNKLSDLQAEQEKAANSTKQLETFFKATGKSVDDFANSLGSSLTNAIKNGTASSKQLEAAISKIGQEALGVGADIDKFKKALSSVDDGASLKSVKKELGDLSKEAKSAEESVSGLEGALEGVAGALVAGGGIAGAVQTALDTSSLNTKINISMEVPEESKAAVKDAINTATSYIGDQEAALEGVRKQWALNKDASDEANAAIVAGAATISATFSEIDFSELIQETNEIASSLGITNEEALGLVNSLLKVGFPPGEIDIIAEYGTQLKMAGYDAEQIQNIFAAGIDAKSWNIDNLLDGIKEGRIQMADFGSGLSKELTGILSQTDISAKQFQTWGQTIAKGGEDGQLAMLEVTKALAGVKDETVRNQLGTQMFGTMWEDQGMKVVDTLLKAEQGTADLKAGVDDVNNSVSMINADAATQLQQAFTNIKTALEPLLLVIASFVSKIAEWVSNNPTLAATITAVVTAIGVLLGACMALAPIFTAIASLAGVLGLSIGAIAAPIGIVVAVIAGLVAAGVLLYKNWDEIMAKAADLKNNVAAKFEELKTAVSEKMTAAKNKISEIWTQAKTSTGNLVESIRVTASTKFEALKATVSEKLTAAKNKVQETWTAARTITSNLVEGIRSAASQKFEALRSTVSEKLAATRNKISEMWSSARTLTSNLVEGIKSTAQSKFQALVSAVASKMSEVKGKVQEGWNKAKAFLEGVNLTSIGRNIIQGLVNGIGSLMGSVQSKIEEIASKIPEWAKKMLGIHSPSRVMMEVGKWVSLGLAAGISQHENAVKDSSEDLAKVAVPDLRDKIKLSQWQFGEITKIAKLGAKERYQAVEQWLSKQKELENISAKNEVAVWDFVTRKFILNADEKRKAQLKLRDAKRAIDQDIFNDEKAWIEERKRLNQLSLTQELQAWEQVASRYAEGSNKRLEAEQQAANVRKAIYDQLKKASDDYLAKVKEVNDNVAKEEQRLNEAYDQAVEQRVKSIQGFAGIFDEIKLDKDVVGTDLLNNLEDQVSYLEDWTKNVQELANRGIDEGLLKELQDMGPKAGQELAALVKLSDEQLSKYQSLWQAKNQLARTQAATELAGLRKDTDQQIQELHTRSAEQLEELKNEFVVTAQDIRHGTEAEFDALSSTLPEIGRNAVEGLMKGMDEMVGPLMDQARAMADEIRRTIQKALDIHSPSRVMKELGQWIPLGLAEGMKAQMGAVIQATNQMTQATIPAVNSASGAAVAGRPIYITFDVDGETLGSKLVDPVAEEIVLRVGR